MPQLERLVPDGGRLDQRVRNLDDTCFDTAGAGLRLFGVTLQRRVGGSETGWQLKIPYGTARTELQIGAPTKGLPRALGKALAGLRAGERLNPVATVNTTRTAYRVLNLDGELVLELADDHVESHLPDGQSTLHSYVKAAKRKADKRLRTAGDDIERLHRARRRAGR